jgi:hypothetical protein
MDTAGFWIDPTCHGVQPERHAVGFEVRDRAMREAVPVAYLAGDVVGDAADRVVRVRIGENDGDFGARVKLTGAERRLDTRVASADRDQSQRSRRSGRKRLGRH